MVSSMVCMVYGMYVWYSEKVLSLLNMWKAIEKCAKHVRMLKYIRCT